MSLKSVLARGRARHAVLLVDACTISRVTGQTLDPDTNQLTPTTEQIYAGECRLKTYRVGRPATAGEASIELQRYELELPWDAPVPVMRDDVATMTAGDDTWVIGRPLTVTDVSYSGTSTARHLIVEDRS